MGLTLDRQKWYFTRVPLYSEDDVVVYEGPNGGSK